MMPVPWFHEQQGPELVNVWTLTHVMWGAVVAHFTDSLPLAMVLHTFYESIEGQIFPVEHRDVSLKNHVGDSIGFAAGFIAARKGKI